jgi:hypothetical protein
MHLHLSIIGLFSLHWDPALVDFHMIYQIVYLHMLANALASEILLHIESL